MPSEGLFRREAFQAIARNRDDRAKDYFRCTKTAGGADCLLNNTTPEFNPESNRMKSHQMNINEKHNRAFIEDLWALRGS